MILGYFNSVSRLAIPMVINIIGIAICITQIVIGGNLNYSIIGSIFVIFAFAHAMLIEDAINEKA